MGHRRLVIVLFIIVLCASSVVTAEDRLALLEFFGRPTGAYCSAAGPAMIALQNQMAGRAVLLEYHYDVFPSGRVDRFWATGVSAPALPLVMVGNGYRTSAGYLSNYESTYRSMINAELARAPEAQIKVYWQRSGTAAKVWFQAKNLSGRTLSRSEATAIWGIAWENARIGVGTTWVRGARRWPMTSDIAAGETVDGAFTIPVPTGTSWDTVSCLVLLENRQNSNARYDMLQAAVALPTGLYLPDETVSVNNGRRSAEITIEGPHVLSWTAESPVPWLEVTPSGDHLPDNIIVTLIPELRPPAATTAEVTITAEGDGMEFTGSVTVEIIYPVRYPHRRMRADQ